MEFIDPIWKVTQSFFADLFDIGSAAGDHSDLEPFFILKYPLFLIRHPQAHNENIRGEEVDLFNDLRLIGGSEESMVGSDDLKIWIVLFDIFNRFFCRFLQ